jgi:hypothetical protein
MKKHISFSELKNWVTCPFYHKLTYIDGLAGFEGNEHTAFGSAMHNTYEAVLKEQATQPVDFFKKSFADQIKELQNKGIPLREELIESMKPQGEVLAPLCKESLDEYFGPHEIVNIEEKLYEPIEEQEINYKGFIDLVVKTPDGKYHIIDWKTCSWGWNARRRSEKLTTYQLTFYKHFWSKKHNIDPSKVETHFALLKRTAKKNNVEIFKVTSGEKKTNNALKLLNKAVYNIKKSNFLKNKASCSNCNFYKTRDCPG